MQKILFRLDDACGYMDLQKWQCIEEMFDRHNVKPIVGVIPKCEDENLISKYEFNDEFWTLVDKWHIKGWGIALHGFNHKYITKKAGINPIHKRSEFAGVSYECQKNKIREGIKIFNEHAIYPELFFAPSHTYDKNTIKALLECSDIKIISDTYASDIYFRYNMFFIPLKNHIEVTNIKILRPFKKRLKLSTHVYHPNTMNENDFQTLEHFITANQEKIIAFENLNIVERKRTFFDMVLSWDMYSYLKFLKMRKRDRQK